MKRKHRDETPETSVRELSIMLAQINDEIIEGSEVGFAKRWQLDEIETKNYDGSGLAEVSVQLR